MCQPWFLGEYFHPKLGICEYVQLPVCVRGGGRKGERWEGGRGEVRGEGREGRDGRRGREGGKGGRRERGGEGEEGLSYIRKLEVENLLDMSRWLNEIIEQRIAKHLGVTDRTVIILDQCNC